MREFRAYMATGILGTFAFDKTGKLLAFAKFSKEPDEIAQKLEDSKLRKLTPGERTVIDRLKVMGLQEVVITIPKDNVMGIQTVVKPDNMGEQILRESFRKLAIDLRFAATQSDINEIMSKVNIELSKIRMRKNLKKDTIILRAVTALDIVSKAKNPMSEILRDWYSLHFPEFREQDHRKYAESVAKYGSRNCFPSEFEAQAASTVGMEFDEKDVFAVRAMANSCMNISGLKDMLESYLKAVSREVAPNLCEIAGEILAARLIAKAGSLEKLSNMPTSSIQLIGAEKALFRHLKGKGKSPKFGIIYSHDLIQKAPEIKKGKMARLLAAKISLAAKTDFFERVSNPSIKAGLDKKAEIIMREKE